MWGWERAADPLPASTAPQAAPRQAPGQRPPPQWAGIEGAERAAGVERPLDIAARGLRHVLPRPVNRADATRASSFWGWYSHVGPTALLRVGVHHAQSMIESQESTPHS